MTDEEILSTKKRVQRLIFLAAGGKIGEDELSRHDVDLRTIGLDSLGYLNLLEGLERTFGVAIDLDDEPDHSFLHTIDNLARYLGQRTERRGAAA